MKQEKDFFKNHSEEIGLEKNDEYKNIGSDSLVRPEVRLNTDKPKYKSKDGKYYYTYEEMTEADLEFDKSISRKVYRSSITGREYDSREDMERDEELHEIKRSNLSGRDK